MIEDAIHPQASGQLVMAFEILSQLGVEKRWASSLTLVKRGKKWAARSVTNFQVNKDGSEISFSYKAPSIPWVIPEEV